MSTGKRSGNRFLKIARPVRTVKHQAGQRRGLLGRERQGAGGAPSCRPPAAHTCWAWPARGQQPPPLGGGHQDTPWALVHSPNTREQKGSPRPGLPLPPPPVPVWPWGTCFLHPSSLPSQTYSDPIFIGADRGPERLKASWHPGRPAGLRPRDQKPSLPVRSEVTGAVPSMYQGPRSSWKWDSGSPRRWWGGHPHAVVVPGTFHPPPTSLSWERTDGPAAGKGGQEPRAGASG